MMRGQWWGLTVAVLGSLNAHAQSEEFTQKLDQVLRLLESSRTGALLMRRAASEWGGESFLRERVVPGGVSRTDAVLTRQFDPETGEETRERKVSIVLRSDQPVLEMALDLAHELLHATTHPSFDPYDPELSLSRYIQASLESRGGEIEAVYFECQVASELEALGLTSKRRCHRYLGSKKEVRIEKIREDFYRVGKWYDKVRDALGAEVSRFPHLKAESPELYSATGGAPYPAALMDEYRQMTQAACENARKRIESSTQSIPERAPASVRRVGLMPQQFLEKRCSRTGAD
jgi:hypothetical protein